MDQVYIFVREDFGLAAKEAAHKALKQSLDHFPDLTLSPWPSTSMQSGIFNISGIMYGFNFDPDTWEERNITGMIASTLHDSITVSHTSALPNTHHYDQPKIEGLNLRPVDFFTKISVTTHYDAHCGYVKALDSRIKTAQKKGLPIGAEVARLNAEPSLFKEMQKKGCILPHQKPAWTKYPRLVKALA